jgi:hypothetical protein
MRVHRRLLLAIGLGALALFAIPAIGSAHNGHHHGTSDPAGTVKSFDSETGVLTVALDDGGDISAIVNRRTKIRCDEDREGHRGRHGRRHGLRARASDSGPGRDGSGDSGDERSGSSHSGDDDNGRADEPGEDNHEHGANEPGEDHHDHGVGRNERCVSALVEGAVVARAEIDLEDGSAFFEKVVVMPAAG